MLHFSHLYDNRRAGEAVVVCCPPKDAINTSSFIHEHDRTLDLLRLFLPVLHLNQPGLITVIKDLKAGATGCFLLAEYKAISFPSPGFRFVVLPRVVELFVRCFM